MSANDNDTPKDACSREDLLELVRAIKFAKPEASQKQVHQEITNELSQKGESFDFLKNVALNDVKKVWKKALQSNTKTNTSTNNADVLEKLKAQSSAPTLFTVGTANTVAHLAQDYTASYLAQQAAEEQASKDELAKDYVHVYLDVPADKSGTRPHQALIHFATKPKSKGKKKGKKAPSTTDNATDSPFQDIVKIQRAAAPPTDTVTEAPKYPMLLYNQSRTWRTFIHPDPPSDNEKSDYDRIQEWMDQAGQTGALGATGGTKAYFYARYTERKSGPSIVSIQVTQLAPAQEW